MRPSPTRAHSLRVPSRRTQSESCSRRVLSRPGARSASSLHDRSGVGVGGAYGYAEPGGDLGEGVVLAQVGEYDEGTLVRRELAAAVTLTGDDEHGDPLDQRTRQDREPTGLLSR